MLKEVFLIYLVLYWTATIFALFNGLTTKRLNLLFVLFFIIAPAVLMTFFYCRL